MSRKEQALRALAIVLVAATVTFLLSVVLTGAFGSDFCEGYEDGYETGYKRDKGSLLSPLSPLCPLEPLREFGDPDEDYEFGFTEGYDEGEED